MGKSRGKPSAAKSTVAWPGSSSATCTGMRASERRKTTALPSATTAGWVSIPAPLVRGSGAPSGSRSRQRWRRSMSPALLAKTMVLPSATRGGVLDLEWARRQQARLAAAGRHRVEVQPTVILGREYQPIAAPDELRVGAERMKHAPGTLRCAVHLGDTRSRRDWRCGWTRVIQSGAESNLPHREWKVCAETRCAFPSGDQRGSRSNDRLASIHSSDLSAKVYTPTKLWSVRVLTKASLRPSG